MKPLPRLKCKGSECMGCSSANCYAGGGMACKGPDCMGCSSPDCMAEGGAVDSWTKREDNEKGIHHSSMHNQEGRSDAGQSLRAKEYGANKGLFEDDLHRKAKRKHHEVLGEMKAMKKPNLYAEGGEVDESDESMDHPVETQMDDFLGDDDPVMGALQDEFLNAIHSKNKKELLEAIEALVLTTR